MDNDMITINPLSVIFNEYIYVPSEKIHRMYWDYHNESWHDKEYRLMIERTEDKITQLPDTVLSKSYGCWRLWTPTQTIEIPILELDWIMT
jgi:hypothetical protein